MSPFRVFKSLSEAQRIHIERSHYAAQPTDGGGVHLKHWVSFVNSLFSETSGFNVQWNAAQCDKFMRYIWKEGYV